MKKTMIILGAWLLFPISAHAHSVLEASTPAEGEVVTEPVVAIALDFSAGIEGGSGMTMTMDGTAVDFSEVAIMDDQLIGTPAEELEDGSYVVEYDVLSEDGHPIQGSLAFELQANEGEVASGEAAQPAESEAEQPAQTEAPGLEQAASDPEAPAENSGSSTTLIIAGLAMILLIAAVVLMRRKR